MTDRELFESIVMQLAEMYDENNIELEDKIIALEDEIEATGMGEAFFFAARDDVGGIEIARYPRNNMFYADYYDGFQAPFTVCEWNGTIEELLKLIEKHDITLQLNDEI